MRVHVDTLIDSLAKKSTFPKSVVEALLHFFIEEIYQTLRDDGEVNIQGFGKFVVSNRAARLGVNPRNPTIPITIPSRRQPKFIAGQTFKNRIAKARRDKNVPK